MKPIALLAPLAVALAACGTDTCSSNPAPLQSSNPNPSCTVAAGQTVTFNVALNCKCSDSSPSCQAEFVNGGIEVSPVFQQCQETLGCNTGCQLTRPTATCTATIPAGTSSPVTLTVVSDTVRTGQIDLGSGTVCNL